MDWLEAAELKIPRRATAEELIAARHSIRKRQRRCIIPPERTFV